MAEHKHIIRLVNTDLDGNKNIISALRKIKGVGFMMANLACRLAKVDQLKKAGSLSDAEVTKLDAVIRDPLKAGAPLWMVNRRNDYETGENRHITSTDIKFNTENDIKRLKMVKTYKGVRHMAGLPVRGQKTKSNFRRNKGKGLGVKRRAGAKAGK